MKLNFFSIIIIYLNILIQTVISTPKIPLANRLRIKACMNLQEKKFGENENILNEFLQNFSYVFPENPNKIILLAMAHCYNKMTDEIANYINKEKLKILDINRPGLKDIYNFENYDYNDTAMNEKIYRKFKPVFNFVYKEMTNQENYKEFWDNYEFYFTKTKLFKFFFAYLWINVFIVYYLRIKNRSKYVDESNNKEDDNDSDDEITENKNDNNDKNPNNHRKLKKKKGLGKNKKD